MNGPRVTPWQPGDPVPPALLSGIQARRPNGELIGIDRILLKSAPLAEGWNGLMRRIRADFSLDLELLELIMLRVAEINGASFQSNVHLPVYLEAGGTRAKAEAVRLFAAAESPLFSRIERVILKITDQSTRCVQVDPALIEDLKALTNEEQAVEVVATIAAYNMVSRFLVALNIL